MNIIPENIELYMTSNCNLKCDYCYISKNKALVAYDKEIKECHENLVYLENIKKIYKNKEDQLISLALWGGEPTMGLDRLTSTLDEYINYFPNLSRFSFSTNMTFGNDQIYRFLEKLSTYKERTFMIGLQISIDGPPTINNFSRNKCRPDTDLNKIIIGNMLKLIDHFNEKDYANIVLKQHFKPTLSMSIINNFLTTEEDIIDYFHYFESLFDLFKSNTKCIGLMYEPPALPNIAVPGEYTSQDGKDFTNFIRRCKTVQNENRANKTFKYYKQLIWFEDHVHYTKEMIKNGKFEQCLCGGCKGSICMDAKGKVHLCHRGFLDSNDAYIESSCETQDIKVFNQSNKEYTLSKKLTSFDLDRFINDEEYIEHLKAIREGDGLRIASTLALITHLAECKQISEVYLHDKKLRLVGALFMLRAENCLQDSAMVTGSYYLKNPSLIKLYLNGIVDDIYKDILLKEMPDDVSRRK